MRMAAAQHALANDWPAMMLRRVDPTRNMSRFWSARLQPSLFEEVLLVLAWGRIGSRGQERSYWFASRQAALAAFEKITAAKRRRGYAADTERAAGAPPARDWTLNDLHSRQAEERPRGASAA